MSVSALHIYEQLTDAPDDKTCVRIIAEAIGQLEDRYPQLKEVATQPHLRETELRLQKEIQLTRLEIKEVEANLQKEIQHTRLEIKEVEAKLQKEIKEVEARLSKEIHLLDLKYSGKHQQNCRNQSRTRPLGGWCRAAANHFAHWRTAQSGAFYLTPSILNASVDCKPWIRNTA